MTHLLVGAHVRGRHRRVATTAAYVNRIGIGDRRAIAKAAASAVRIARVDLLHPGLIIFDLFSLWLACVNGQMDDGWMD
jgi:hypothetical protein